MFQVFAWCILTKSLGNVLARCVLQGENMVYLNPITGKCFRFTSVCLAGREHVHRVAVPDDPADGRPAVDAEQPQRGQRPQEALPALPAPRLHEEQWLGRRHAEQRNPTRQVHAIRALTSFDRTRQVHAICALTIFYPTRQVHAVCALTIFDHTQQVHAICALTIFDPTCNLCFNYF